MSSSNESEGKTSKDEEKQILKACERQKETIKKKISDKTCTSAAINFDNFERNKVLFNFSIILDKFQRRNSLTDSPLTGLSPSSGASNGDSADDIAGIEFIFK